MFELCLSDELRGTRGHRRAVVNQWLDPFDPAEAFICAIHVRLHCAEDGLSEAELRSQTTASYSTSTNGEDEHKPWRPPAPSL